MSLNPAVTAKYNLGPVKSWVEQAAYKVGPMFGVKTILGWRKTDPFPDHPSGHALDFMITSKSQGQQIADYLTANASALGVKYVIWNRQVWEASGRPVVGWHAYTSTSNPHTDHVHVTFNDQPGNGQYTDISLTTSTGTTGPTSPQCAWGFHVPVAGDTCILSKTQARSFLGGSLVVAGAIVGIMGLTLLVILGLGKTPVGPLIPIARSFK